MRDATIHTQGVIDRLIKERDQIEDSIYSLNKQIGGLNSVVAEESALKERLASIEAEAVHLRGEISKQEAENSELVK
eukprot:gene6069-16053_t